MNAQKFLCPACGAPLKITHKFSKMAVCSYCAQPVAITPNGLDPTGQKGMLADNPSVFSVGRSGKINQKIFRTLGHIRYRHIDGFWDEWLLLFEDGTEKWMQEDEGTFVLFEKQLLKNTLPSFSEIRVGTNIPLGSTSFFVTEKTRAVLAGGEGELSFPLFPGQAVDCVDGIVNEKILSIEFLPDEITLSVGASIDANAIFFEK